MYIPEPGNKPRLFLALWPGDKLRRALVDIIDQLPDPGARWVKPENLHITLSFLGNVQAERIPEILEQLTKVDFLPFSFSLDYILYVHRSKMLWFTPKQRSEPLLSLLNSISERMQLCGFKPEKRPFSPHITIARKMKTPIACQSVSSVRWPVSSFCLVESETGKGGSRYFVRQSWPSGKKDVGLRRAPNQVIT